MKTDIKSSCPACGDVVCDVRQVRLNVCIDPALSYFAFPCPECSTDVYHHAAQWKVRLLLPYVTPYVWEVPDELLEEHSGPALTYDDLLDLRLALDAEVRS